MASARKRVGSVVANVQMLDMFGDSVNIDPARFPKIFEGVLASILFIGIALLAKIRTCWRIQFLVKMHKINHKTCQKCSNNFQMKELY